MSSFSMDDDVRNGRRFANRQLAMPCITSEELEYRTPLGTPDSELSQPITDDSAMEELAEKIRSALDKLKDAVSDEEKVDDTVDEIRNTDEVELDSKVEVGVGYKFGDGELAELVRSVLDKIDIESSQRNTVNDRFDEGVKDNVNSVAEFNVVFDNRTNEKSEDKDDDKYECSAVDNVAYIYMDINQGKKCDKIDDTEAANDEVAKHSNDDKVDSIFDDKENSDNKYYRETDDGNDCKVEKYSSDYEFSDKIKDKFNNIENYNSDKNIYGRIGTEFNGKVDKKFEDVEDKVDEKFKLGDDDDKKFSNAISDDTISNKEIDDEGEYESKHKTVTVGNKVDDIVDEERDNDIDNKFGNKTDDTVDDEIGDTDYKIESKDECKEAVILRNDFDDKVDKTDDKGDQDDVVECKVVDKFEWKDDEEVRSITKKKIKKGENSWLCRLNCRKEHSISIEDFTLDTLESRVIRPTDFQKKEKLRRVRKLFGCFSCTRVPREYMENLPSLVYRMR